MLTPFFASLRSRAAHNCATRMRDTLRLTLALACILTFALGLRAADWPLYHRSADNNVMQSPTYVVKSLDAGATWQTTTSEHLVTGGGIVVAGGHVLAVAQTGGDTWADSGDDTFCVRAYDPFTGTRLWSSPLLPPGSSVGNGSLTTPAIDPAAATPAAYIAAGNTVHRLNLSDGSITWSRALTTSSTTPGLGGYDVINSSPILGAGALFIEVNGGMFNSADKQIVALDAATGAIRWFHNDGGPGLGTPLFVELGTTRTVYTATTGGVAAYDAVTGALRWSNDSVLAGTTWTLANDVWGSLTYADGYIYGATYSFSGSGNQLFCANALTGELRFKVSTLSTDVVPLVLNGAVYVQGGLYGAAQLQAHNAATGAVLWTVSPGGTSYRTQMAAAEGRIYMTDQHRLMIIDAANGAILSSATGDFYGAVAMDSTGALYVHNGEALAAFRNVASSAFGWAGYQ
jgi:outer membrane protein assembly factor BamB